MNTKEILIKIKKRYIDLLNAYSNDWYKETEYSPHISALEIAISLTELAVFEGRAIREDEEQWFKGEYHLSYILLEPWDDMLSLYKQLVENLKKENFYR